MEGGRNLVLEFQENLFTACSLSVEQPEVNTANIQIQQPVFTSVSSGLAEVSLYGVDFSGVVKTEPEDYDGVAWGQSLYLPEVTPDLYPEVTLKEEVDPKTTISPEHQYIIDSNKCLSLPNRSKFPRALRISYLPKKIFIATKTLSSLRKSCTGILSDRELRRSLNCFVPIVPLPKSSLKNISAIPPENRNESSRETRFGEKSKLKRNKLGVSPEVTPSKGRSARVRNKMKITNPLEFKASVELSPDSMTKKARSRRKSSRRARSSNAEKKTSSQVTSHVGDGLKLKISNLVKSSVKDGRKRKIKVSLISSGENEDEKIVSDRVFACSICLKEFRNQKGLDNHSIRLENVNDKEDITSCFECNVDLKHPNCLLHHRRKVHRQKVQEKRSRKVPTSKVCEICQKVFSRVSGLVYHRRQVHHLGNSVERRYKCGTCEKTFIQRTHLRTHEKIHEIQDTSKGTNSTSVAPLSDEDEAANLVSKLHKTCELCGKSFTRTAGLNYHRRQVHELGGPIERKFKCTICDKSFLKRSHLTFHNQTHTGENLFPCRYCLKSFPGSTRRRVHEEKIHGGNGANLSAEEVEKYREAAAQMPQPPPRVRRTTTEPVILTCSYCPKTFTLSSTKRIHERSHTGEKPYLCVTCGKSYKSAESLKEHDKMVHTLNFDLLCPHCGTAFGRQMTLKYHIMSKHTERQFKCDFQGCERTFIRKAAKQKHVFAIHSKGYVQCDICNHKVRSSEEMVRHLKFHEIKKKRQMGLGVRRRVTGGVKEIKQPKPRRVRLTPAPERKLQCSYCDKRFPYRNELRNHTKAVHTDERDFKCEVDGCSKAFVTNYKLLVHRKSSHGIPFEPLAPKVEECDVCGKTVHGSARLEKHIISRHPEVAMYRKFIHFPDVSPQKRRRSKEINDGLILNSTNMRRSGGTVKIGGSGRVDSLPPPTTSIVPVSAHSQQQRPAHAEQNEAIAAIVNSAMTHQYQQCITQNQYGSQAPVQGSHETMPFFSFNPMGQSGYGQDMSDPGINTSWFQSLPFQQNHYQPYPNFPNYWPAHQSRPQSQHYQTETSHYPVHAQEVPFPSGRNIGRESMVDYSSDMSDLIQFPQGNVDEDEESGAADREDPDYIGNENDNISSENDDGVENSIPPILRQVEVEIPTVIRKPRERPGHTPKEPKFPPKRKVPGRCARPGQKKRGPPKLPPELRKPKVKKQIPCHLCEKVFGTNQHLREHLAVHEKREREKSLDFRCSICGKSFKCDHHLRVHSVIHDPTIKPYKCKVEGCGETFGASTLLKKHRDMHPNVRKKVFRCRFCTEVFEARAELLSHRKTIHSDTMHACTHPGCTFFAINSSLLGHHMDTHLEKEQRDRPYKCHLCQCSYMRGSNLQQHLDNMHKGAGSSNPLSDPLTCPKCPKTYYFEWRLKDHLQRSHLPRDKIRPRKTPRPSKSRRPLFHYCAECDWTFGSGQELSRHFKSKHKGSEPLACLRSGCEKNYFSVEKLEMHLRMGHGEIEEDEEKRLNELREREPMKEESETDLTRHKGKLNEKWESNRRSLGIQSDEEYLNSEDSEEIKEQKEQELPRRRSGRKVHIQSYATSDDEDDIY